MKKGIKKCVNCKEYKKCKFKKGAKNFCSSKCKKEYYDNHIPTLIKDIQEEFNSLVAKGQPCSKCGKRFEVMQCSHVWSIGSAPGIRFDILNVLAMCGHCHNYWYHLEPMESKDWFKNNYPNRYEYLEFARHQNKKWTASELNEIREAIRNRDLQALIRFRQA